MVKEQVQKRLARLRSKMAEADIDFYMIPTADYHHSEYVDDYFKLRDYFSGFTGSNGTLIVGRESAGLWTDGRYFIQAEHELAGTGITLFRMLEEGVPDRKQFLTDHMKKGDCLAFDGRTVTCKEGLSFESQFAEKEIRILYREDLAGELWENRPPMPVHEVMVLPDEISGLDIDKKLELVRTKIKEAGAQYFLLSKLDDLMWLLNIRGSDVACNPVALSYAFIKQDEVFLFLQKEAVTDELAEYAGAHRINLCEYADVENFIRTYPYEGKVFIDSNHSGYSLYRAAAAYADIVMGDNPTESLKAVKNETELMRMKEVYDKDSAAVIKWICYMKKHAGTMPMTEVTAAEYMDKLRGSIDGFLDLSFPTICAYQANAAMMHYEADVKCCSGIEAEGMLLLDSGGQYMGGTTDVTRTIVLGEITKQMKMHFTKAAIGMLRLSAAKFLYGCTGRNLDILARQPLWEAGIDYKCGTGHGIGYILNVHEGPQSIRWRFANGAKEAAIEAGMVISNEPGVYIEGSHGIRTENVMYARNLEKNGDGQFMGFETLTYVPIDRDGIDTAYMTTEDMQMLNTYHAQVYEKMKDYLEEEERVWLKQATAEIVREDTAEDTVRDTGAV